MRRGFGVGKSGVGSILGDEALMRIGVGVGREFYVGIVWIACDVEE